MKRTYIISIAVIGTPLALFQADLIPPSVWEQMPFVVLISGAIIYLARLYFQDQEKQRISTTNERKEEREAHEKSLREQREAQVNLLQIMLAANKETFELSAKIQAEAMDEGMEKIASQYYRVEKRLGGIDG